MATVDIDAGTVHYDATGPATGRPVVFIHGYAMGSSLWGPLSTRLADTGLRCIAPTWPLGAHPTAMRRDADMTLPGIAAMVAALLAALDLHDVLLVGNDTGGVVAQLVAVKHPERLGGLVLTSCDAFEHFPPPILKPLILAARTRPTFRAALQPLRAATVRKRAFGALSHHDIDHLVVDWVKPSLGDAAIAEDLRRLTVSLDRQTTVEVGARLGEFGKPALVAWSADDALFPVEDGRRLAAALPDARFDVIDGARTFSMLDRTDRLGELLTEFADAADTAPGRPAQRNR